MRKIHAYEETLQSLSTWEPFLLQESGLPGPRGNLELAQAAANVGTESLFRHWLTYDATQAPTNTPQEFLAFCGTLGMGTLLINGDLTVLKTLQQQANDPRWRTREAVAMALQNWGTAHMESLLHEMSRWRQGSLLERRAAIAALCEPRLLQDQEQVGQVLRILDKVTASLPEEPDSRSDAYLALRKGLGYCWSVAIAAYPDMGKPMLEHWLSHPHKDIRWILTQNLKKKRLERIDPAWVSQCLARL